VSISNTFPTIASPSLDNASWEQTARVRKAQFDDGYEQRTVDGINTMPRSFTVEWPCLTTTDKDTLLTFLRARAGSEPFNFTPPGEVSAVVVIASKWTTKKHSGVVWGVTINFEQMFDK
jgi:phage-related protein